VRKVGPEVEFCIYERYVIYLSSLKYTRKMRMVEWLFEPRFFYLLKKRKIGFQEKKDRYSEREWKRERGRELEKENRY
jgi:hypothetical protein